MGAPDEHLQTELAKQFPRLKFEDGFVENDELWNADERETDAHMQLRSQRALDRLFGENGVKETCKWSRVDQDQRGDS